MKRDQVQSSNIQAIGYDENSATLEVEFLNGGVYQYFDVPKNVYDEFINATESHGKYLAQYIKGHYRFSKV